jgi:hypothetical protein
LKLDWRLAVALRATAQPPSHVGGQITDIVLTMRDLSDLPFKDKSIFRRLIDAAARGKHIKVIDMSALSLLLVAAALDCDAAGIG